MTVSGFPDSLQFSRLSTSISQLKRDSEQARVEISTGQVTDVGRALGTQTGDAQLVLKAIADLDTFRVSINRGLSRASISQLVLTRIAEPTASLGSDLLAALTFGDETGIRLAGDRARGDLETAIAGFNQRYEGRSLFSGDATDGPALGDPLTLINDVAAIFTGAVDAAQFEADLDTYFNDPAGGFATSFYQGGNGNAPRVQLDDQNTVDVSARADELEIKNVLKGLVTAAVAGNAPASAKRNEVLDKAGRDVIGAGAALTEIRARIGVGEGRLQGGLDRLELEELALTQRSNDLTAIDPFEAASRLQQLETQLAASFTLSARISRLSLVNFL